MSTPETYDPRLADATQTATEQSLAYREWFISSVTKAVAKADAGGPFLSHEDVMAELSALVSDKC